MVRILIIKELAKFDSVNKGLKSTGLRGQGTGKALHRIGCCKKKNTLILKIKDLAEVDPENKALRPKTPKLKGAALWLRL